MITAVYPGADPETIETKVVDKLEEAVSTVNGIEMGAQPTSDGIRPYTWDVPAERWRAGLNELALSVQGATSPRESGLSADGRVLGVLVTRITLEASLTPDAHTTPAK